MASKRAEQQRFTRSRHVPKRLRRTRRELPYGQVRRWGSTVGNFSREREARILSLYYSTEEV